MTDAARRLAWAACGVAAASGVWAQSTPAAGETQRVEITAREETDTEQRRREPVAKTIVGREELDRYGDNSVVDVLKRQPGVNLSGGNPRLRGLGSGYTLILVNGEPAPPGFSLDNLAPSQIERIEITKGPSAEYSAQAVAGTINIVLRQAPRQSQRELRLNLGYNQDRPEPSANGLWSDRLGDWSFTLPVAAYRWRGGAANVNDRLTRDVAGDPQRIETISTDRWWGGGYNLGPRLSWKPDARNTVELQSFGQRNDWRSAGHVDTAVLDGSTPSSVDDDWASRGHWRTARATASWVRRGEGGDRLELRATAQGTDSRNEGRFLGLDAGGQTRVERYSDARTREASRSAGAKFTWPVGDSHRLMLGWEGEVRQRREQRSVVENGLSQLVGFDGEPFFARVGRQAVFVQDEWEPVPRWGATLGVRGERIDTRSTGSDDTLRARSEVVTPMLHAVHRLREGGRDQIRLSLTRSYRAPDLGALMARPSISPTYPASGPNAELVPDRVGNPALRPELSTGLDLAFEKYLAQGGVVSVGVFHRRIRDLMRNRLSLQTVSWSPVPRWVSQPVNLAEATSTGLEFEAKGRLDEWMDGVSPTWRPLALRASLSVYRSSVRDLPAPDNRLDGQQPWQLTLGADHPWPGTPVTWGLNLVYTPSYAVQQTAQQRLELVRGRALDAYLLWTFDRQTLLRLSVNNAWPLRQESTTLVQELSGFVQTQTSRRQVYSSVNLNLTLKF